MDVSTAISVKVTAIRTSAYYDVAGTNFILNTFGAPKGLIVDCAKMPAKNIGLCWIIVVDPDLTGKAKAGRRKVSAD